MTLGIGSTPMRDARQRHSHSRSQPPADEIHSKNGTRYLRRQFQRNGILTIIWHRPRQQSIPDVWLTLIVVLMNTLDRMIPKRMAFTSPNSDLTHSRLINAFVDGTSLGYTDPGLLTLETMIEKLNRIAPPNVHRFLEMDTGM